MSKIGMDVRQEAASKEIKLLQSRETMYRFLSRLYLLEVDGPLFAALRNMEFPTGRPWADMEKGYQAIRTYIQENACVNCEADWQRALDDLAVDYARIFLSAGIAQGKAAFPYASVYTSRQRLMMQDAQQDVAALYAQKGLEPAKDGYQVPQDHIGLLLEYMARLCREEAEAVKNEAEAVESEAKAIENETKAIESEAKADGTITARREQAEFLEHYICNWAPAFTDDVIRYADTDFYRGIGMLTKGFLEMEQSLIL